MEQSSMVIDSDIYVTNDQRKLYSMDVLIFFTSLEKELISTFEKRAPGKNEYAALEIIHSLSKKAANRAFHYGGIKDAFFYLCAWKKDSTFKEVAPIKTPCGKENFNKKTAIKIKKEWIRNKLAVYQLSPRALVTISKFC
jgi:hypothetical protein